MEPLDGLGCGMCKEKVSKLLLFTLEPKPIEPGGKVVALCRQCADKNHLIRVRDN